MGARRVCRESFLVGREHVERSVWRRMALAAPNLYLGESNRAPAPLSPPQHSTPNARVLHRLVGPKKHYKLLRVFVQLGVCAFDIWLESGGGHGKLGQTGAYVGEWGTRGLP